MSHHVTSPIQAIFYQHQHMVSMHFSSFTMPIVAQIIVTFYYATRLLSQGYKVNNLSNTFKKFYGRHTDIKGAENSWFLSYRRNMKKPDQRCNNLSNHATTLRDITSIGLWFDFVN